MKTSVILLLFFTLQVNFCVSQNTWTQKTNFGGHERSGAIGFSIGNKGYIGLGSSMYGNIDSLQKDFWEYDPATDTWTKKADFPGTNGSTVGFSIGNKGYVGLGYNSSSGTFLKDFWEYDPATDTWTQKTDFPGTQRGSAMGFSIGTKGYVGLGFFYLLNNYYYKDFWEYNPVTDTWTQKADYSGRGRTRALGFSIGNKGYIGTGADTNDNIIKDFWEYNPATDTWTQKADFFETRADAVGFSIGSKGYVGTGVNTNNILKKDFWEYDPVIDVWTQKTDFPDTARVNAVCFSIGTKGYIGTGFSISIIGDIATSYQFKDFWEYSPALNVNELSPNDNHIKLYYNKSNMLILISPVSLIEVNIYNVLGKNLILYRPDVLQNSVEINVSGIGTGVYFAKIQTANGEIISKKFIITN